MLPAATRDELLIAIQRHLTDTWEEHLLTELGKPLEQSTAQERAELDLNPVIARPDGVIAVDARIRVTSHRLADPFLRQLPPPPHDAT